LYFTTGALKIPPVGFHPRPQIEFNPRSQHPGSNACGNVLYLPTRYPTYEDFRNKMCEGIINGIGYGKV